MSLAGWSDAEARRRIATLRACGWSAKQLALMFGVSIDEIERLAGGHFITEKDCASVG